ncbi:MAG: putative baseplate assembly protein [Acidobacteriaceae bacterium]|nr:putative baseplate assembly protein [Acidobacteriaceae bacterium]MBV9778551.1 putative baseplate assembly protein [Acidobacteriaceae bacterium]
MIQIFANMCGTVIDRLNRAPRKNLLAFLDMQGIAVRPAQAARVPLTFYLAAQHDGHVTVPARTQVAAKPEKRDTGPVVFETERELVVTSASLEFLGAKDGTKDSFSDYSAILKGSVANGVPVFEAVVPIEHLFYVDLNLALPVPALKELRLNLRLLSQEQPSRVPWFQWEVKRVQDSIPITPAEDDTDRLSKSGAVIFRSLPEVPVTTVDGVKGQWLVCRLMVPFGVGPGRLGPSSIPSLEGAEITTEFARHTLLPDVALFNQTTLDITKDFFPFGERPKFGDTFYLACREAFSLPDAFVTVQFNLANPEHATPEMRLPPVHGYGVKLLWELGDGKSWIALGTSESGREVHDDVTGFSDMTKALTHSGTLSFRVPSAVKPITLGGANNFWLRSRIVAGDYGRDPRLEAAAEPGARLPSPPAPPCIGSATIDYNLNTTAADSVLLAYNDFQYARVDTRARPVPLFQQLAEVGVWFYLGFVDRNGFSDRSMSIYVSLASPSREGALYESSGAKPVLNWQYWNGTSWQKWTVLDGTDGFTRSGILRFLAPRDFAVKQEFGKTMSWLRVLFREKTDYKPRVRRVVLNTTIASHAMTLPPEILGGSNGTAEQSFTTTRSPVLQGQQLEIREPTAPSAREKSAILLEEGTDAIRTPEPSEGPTSQVWIRWHEVPNFKFSTEKDRHYTIDRESGKIAFGDGVTGRIPPPLNQNVRMAQYRIGGGAVGNRKPNTITSLKTAIAYVNSVTNVEPASGGADQETYAAMLRRAPREIRHLWRAVTAQDYEDLALLASPEVARARCLPTFDVSKGSDPAAWRPGVVSVIIAPAVAEGEDSSTQPIPPMPSVELIDRVRNFMDAHRPSEIDLVIAGPEYLLIKVETEIAIISDATASSAELAVALAIKQFLHPVTGNRDGNGWQFGQLPTRSDLFALIEQIPGVDHVRELQIITLEARPGVVKQRQFLLFPAEPQVTATSEI